MDRLEGIVTREKEAAGQSPRDEAVRVLTQCRAILDAHLAHAQGEAEPGAARRARRASPAGATRRRT